MPDQTGLFSGKPTGKNPWPRTVKNGQIPLHLMRRCESQPHLGTGSARYLYPPAAIGMDLMTAAAKRDGIKIELRVGYRDLAGQRERKAYWTARHKPGNAATPGRSLHGWAVAGDLRMYPGVDAWMRKHAPLYGWDRPRWADDNVGTEEDWHFQFIDGWTPPEEEMEQMKPITVRLDGKETEIRGVLSENGVSYVSTSDLAKALKWPSPEWTPPRRVNLRTKP